MAEKRGTSDYSNKEYSNPYNNNDSAFDKLVQGNRLIGEANNELLYKLKEKNKEISLLNSKIDSLSKENAGLVPKSELIESHKRLHILKKHLYDKENLISNYTKQESTLEKSIAIKEEQLKELGRNLAVKEQETKALKQRLSDSISNREFNMLKQELETKDKLCNNFLEEINALKKESILKTEELIDLRNSTKSYLKEKDDKITWLTNGLASLKKNSSEQMPKHEFAKLSQKLNLLKQQLFEKDKLCNDYIKQIAALKENNDIKSEQSRAMSEQISNSISKKNEELSKLRKQLESLHKMQTEHLIPKQKYLAIKQELDSKETLCRNFLEEINSHIRNYELKKEEADDLKQKLSEALKEKSDSIKKIRDELSETKNRSDIALKEKDKFVKELNKKLEVLDKDITDSKYAKKIELLKQQLFDKEKMCDYYAKEINILKNSLNIKEEEVGAIRQHILDRSVKLNEKIKELTDQVSYKDEALAQLKNQAYEKDQIISENNEKLVSLKQTTSIKDKDIAEYNHELLIRDQKISQLHERISELIKSASEKEGQIESLKLHLIKQDDMAIKLSNDAVLIKQTSNSIKDNYDKLLLENAELSEELESLRYQLSKYKSLLNEKEKKQKIIFSEFNNKFKDLIIEQK